MSPDPEMLRLAAAIIAAHVSHNTVSVDELPDLFRSVYAALSRVGLEMPNADQPQPAVPVKKSVFPTYIVCLEDGQKLTALKRHLRTSHGLTPEAYRQRWGLPGSYPMVAPSYAATRSVVAKTFGLGRKAARPKEPVSPPVQHVPEGERGRSEMRSNEISAEVDSN